MTIKSHGMPARLAPRRILMGAVRAYQVTVSPLLGPRCKYYPSCSHYGYQALSQHGAVKGSALAVWRVLRCNPWSNGGVDDVPGEGEKLFRLHRNNATVPSGSPPSRNSSVNDQPT
ncbi:MAG: membrane protein insertion efficiency factor YidD [Demequina sp.]